jgi:hypothetical protein
LLDLDRVYFVRQRDQRRHWVTDRTASTVLPACRLWEKVSASGNRYLVGRLGGVKVLVMVNNRPKGEGDATHTLLFIARAIAPAQRIADLAQD